MMPPEPVTIDLPAWRRITLEILLAVANWLSGRSRP
jgi:hypothetical protein